MVEDLLRESQELIERASTLLESCVEELSRSGVHPAVLVRACLAQEQVSRALRTIEILRRECKT